MNSRAYQFQLQAADAAAVAAAPVHVAEAGDESEVTPKALLLKIQAQGASRQGSGGLAPATMGIIGNAEAIKCPECPKWFASEKAMFGHLRKHPERGYKGATRPTTTTAASGAAAAAVAAGDKKLTKKVPRKETRDVPANMVMAAAAAEKKAWEEAELSTKCKWWSATAKRGRTPVAPVPAASSRSCSSEEEEAAMILLEMAAASSSRTSSEAQQQQRSVEPPRDPNPIPSAVVSGHQIQMPVVEEPVLLDHHHPAGHQTPAEAEQQIVQPENALVELSAESQTTPAAVKQVTDLVITAEAAVLIVVPANSKKPAIFPSLDTGAVDKKQVKKRRVSNPEQTAAAASSPPRPEEGTAVRTPPPARRIPSPASDKKHTCPTCGKSFPTHQALGGHMASHVKGSKTSARHDDLAAAQAMHNILAHRDQSAAGNGNGNASAGTHREQSAGNGNVIITASAGAHRDKGAGIGNVIITASAGAGANALQERKDPQPPLVQAPTPTPQTAAPHVCDECRLEFRSGQALGGHKRKHWRIPEKHQAKAAAAPALLDFDLNELPKEGQGENDNQP